MDGLAQSSPLPFLLTTLAALALGLGAIRVGRATSHAAEGARWARRPWGTPVTIAVLAIALLSSAPLLAALPDMLVASPWLPGDAAAHARVAHELGAIGVERGWVTSFNGGFPFGPHYQPAALLVSGGLVWLGLSPASATMFLGAFCVMLVPPAFVGAAKQAGAPPGAALAGALLTAWVNPVHLYMGGPWVVISEGLVSQAVATLLILGTAWCIVGAMPPWVAPILGAAVAASHAQLAVCALLVGGTTVWSCGNAHVRKRFGWASAGAIVTGVALYAPGLGAMGLPFGWPNVPEFRVAGFPPERFVVWVLEGRLLDVGRAPMLTCAAWFAVVVLVLTVRRRASRTAGILLATVLAVVLGGTSLARLSAIGLPVIEIFSPVRMLCLVPLALAVALTAAMAEIGARLGALGSARFRVLCWQTRPAELGLLAAFLFVTGPAALDRLDQRLGALDAARRGRCRAAGWAGFDGSNVAARLRELGEGRLVVHQAAPVTPCPIMAGLDLASPVPLGVGQGGPGTQVGVLAEAFKALHADQPDGAERAEALGVRTLLHPAATEPEPPERWRLLANDEDVALSERVGGSSEVSVGCVRAIWRGRRADLRQALFRDFSAGGVETLRAQSFVRLESSDATLERESLTAGNCRPEDAELQVSKVDAGSWSASVVTPTPVAVVVRATYSPWWTVTLDGSRVVPELFAPGFVGIELPPGRHALQATVGLPAWYYGELLASAIVLLLLAFVAGRAREAGADA